MTTTRQRGQKGGIALRYPYRTNRFIVVVAALTITCVLLGCKTKSTNDVVEPADATVTNNDATATTSTKDDEAAKQSPPTSPEATPLTSTQIVQPHIATASAPKDLPKTDIRLTDVTAQSKIHFQHTHGGSGEGYIVEGMASGMAIFDYDGDGYEDVYFLNGAPLKGTKSDTTPRNALYHNNGNWTFTDVTGKTNTGDAGFAMGATVGDYDNDGDLDLFITNFGPNVLLRNDGGKFTDVTAEAGVDGGQQIGAGASFFDMDADGDLDLYVANYVNFTYENHVPIVIKGQKFQAGPQYYEPVPDTLYRNDGDGRFTDVSKAAGIDAVSGPGMATLCFDADDDGDQDIFVCNDGQANFLFVNDGHGKFEENAVLAGLAYDFHGKANSSMGVDCGDFDGDGKLDLFVTDYQAEMPVVYRNLGDGLFADTTTVAKVDSALFAHVHWGTAFVDFDNDTDRDLFIACGHFDRIETIDDRTTLKTQNYLLMNRGDGTFVDVSKQAGSGLQVIESSRAAAFDDLDNDGDIDVVVLNSDGLPTILRNDTETDHHWLQLHLQMPTKNRFAVGARVRVRTGETIQVAEVTSGRGYQSYFGTRLSFGLGDHDHVDSVEVDWPDGTTETFAVEGVDRRIDLEAGRGKRKAEGE